MQRARPIILILTTQTGGGHLNLAQSLKGILETAYDVRIMNPQSPSVERSYTLAMRHGAYFLTWQHVCTDHPLSALLFQRMLSGLVRERIRQLLEQVRPHLLITTHALLAYAAARANEQLSKRIPLVFQLTDLGRLHMTWFSERHADAYLAPTPEIFAQTIAQGIAPARVHLTGRPVRPQFLTVDLTPGARSKTLQELGLDQERLTIFLQGGANGATSVECTLQQLLRAAVPVQIMLALGNNPVLAQRCAGLKDVVLLPFTPSIAPYLAAADVIAGKAGASFISEAFMVEKPFLATDFVRGQETPNLSFIERHGLGWVCLDAQAQQSLLSSIVTNPALLAEQRAGIQAYKRWNMQANQAIFPLIERLLGDTKP